MRDGVSGRSYQGFFGGYLYIFTDLKMRLSTATTNDNTTFARMSPNVDDSSHCSFCGILHELVWSVPLTKGWLASQDNTDNYQLRWVNGVV